jgi:hypothetical protein
VDHTFAIATRDELWSGGALLESRASHGIAVTRGTTIDARDTRHAVLAARAESRAEAMRAIARELRDARVRLVASARRINDFEREESWLSITIDGVSIITTPDALDPLPPQRVIARHERVRALPIVWHDGSAAVLLHEAVGHAAEHHHEPLQLPDWLTIHDEPDFAIDDAGNATRIADLKRGESPGTWRREDFRDVPLPRMTRLVARQQNAPFELPDEHIDVHLIAGGGYEPLTGEVTLSIAVASIGATPLAPFQLRMPRQSIRILGATGEPLRYPGVVCAREGQEVVVGSYAPVMLTA